MNIYENCLRGLVLVFASLVLHFGFAEPVEQFYEKDPAFEKPFEEISSNEALKCVIRNIFGCWVDVAALEDPEDCLTTFYQTDESDQLLCLTGEKISTQEVSIKPNEPLACVIEDLFGGCWVALEDMENPGDCKTTAYQAEEPYKELCLIKSASKI